MNTEHGAFFRAAAAVAALLALLSACTGSDADQKDSNSLPYDESLFPSEDSPRWCELLPELIPDNGFMVEGVEYDIQGNNTSCDIGQRVDQGFRDIGVNVFGQWNVAQTPAGTMFEELITSVEIIPVDGVGSEAALVPMDTVPKYFSGSANLSRSQGLSLLILEGNLVLEFEAYSYAELGGPELRLVSLDMAAETVLGTAEAYLDELGAENHVVEQSDFDPVGIAAIPDLCEALDLADLELAADQADWVEDSEFMDRCHWQGGDTDLWLSAEAVGPLSVVGLSAEEFATWWTGTFATTGGESLNLGDESYVVSLDPDTDELEAPATDFVVRVGNVVLQGRYSDGIGDPRTAAEGFAAGIMEQVQALLAGS